MLSIDEQKRIDTLKVRKYNIIEAPLDILLQLTQKLLNQNTHRILKNSIQNHTNQTLN